MYIVHIVYNIHLDKGGNHNFHFYTFEEYYMNEFFYQFLQI